MILQVAAILAWASLVSSRPDGYHHAAPSYHAPSKHHFAYAINDDYKGTNFGHSESRDGYLTKGHYFVDLPDGRRQDVHYTADEYGYHPVVTYSGKAHHPVSSYGHGGHQVHGSHGGHGSHVVHGGHAVHGGYDDHGVHGGSHGVHGGHGSHGSYGGSHGYH